MCQSMHAHASTLPTPKPVTKIFTILVNLLRLEKHIISTAFTYMGLIKITPE